ncbi:hypothetical protein, partial [Microcystis sp. M113S1]|uniref:hypothetical protein n=1 Tax=Microcystis sp. M113S1 TaxID=2771104 RepID=UPI0025892690
RASDCQDFVNTEALTLSLSKCRALLFYTGRGFIPSRSSEGLHPDIQDQQFSFQKVTIYTDRNRDLTGGKIAIANQCWTGVISAIQSL